MGKPLSPIPSELPSSIHAISSELDCPHSAYPEPVLLTLERKLSYGKERPDSFFYSPVFINIF